MMRTRGSLSFTFNTSSMTEQEREIVDGYSKQSAVDFAGRSYMVIRMEQSSSPLQMSCGGHEIYESTVTVDMTEVQREAQ